MVDGIVLHKMWIFFLIHLQEHLAVRKQPIINVGNTKVDTLILDTGFFDSDESDFVMKYDSAASFSFQISPSHKSSLITICTNNRSVPHL